MTARIYVRTSPGDDPSIFENQVKTTTEYAEKRFPEALRYEDKDVSGGQEERPGLGSLMRDVRPGDVVIFTAPSRMTRGGLGAAMHILYQLEQMGAGWHFTDWPILNFDASTAPMVRAVILAFLTEYDADYRRRISVRTKAALALAKSQGKNVGGRREGAGRPRKNQGSPPPPSMPVRLEFKAPLKSEGGP